MSNEFFQSRTGGDSGACQDLFVLPARGWFTGVCHPCPVSFRAAPVQVVWLGKTGTVCLSQAF
jgi:hypothetical protein